MLTPLQHVQSSGGSRGAAAAQSALQNSWDNTVATSPQTGTSVPALVSELSLPRPEDSRGSRIRCVPCIETNERHCLLSPTPFRRTVGGGTAQVCSNCSWKTTPPETSDTRNSKYDEFFDSSRCNWEDVKAQRHVRHKETNRLRGAKERRKAGSRERAIRYPIRRQLAEYQYLINPLEY